VIALAGRPPEDVARLLPGQPAFRARQIERWIRAGASTFDEMRDLPRDLRADLASRFRVYSSHIDDGAAAPGDGDAAADGAGDAGDEDAAAGDGAGDAGDAATGDGNAKKFRVRLDDGAAIESVILTDGAGRRTACISTQAGCPVGCAFCKTGSIGFKRNLRAEEIAEQFLLLRQRAPDISHIVAMGMGEPLLNLAAFRRAVAYLTDPRGLNISRRRVTVSTSGVVEGIVDLAENGPDVRLAVSLTTARPDLRAALMPIARANPLPLLKDSLLRYQRLRKRRVTLEAALLGGVNTTDDDARALAAFARGLDVLVNLIPWNPVAGLPFRPPAAAEVTAFAAALTARGFNVTVRREKGRDVSGACGQLGEP